VSYDDLRGRLDTWRNDNGTTIYWRGHDKWTDRNWDRAWNSRWNGYSYDHDHGWWHHSSRSHRSRRRHR
jgi:hypothetical protein